MTVCSWRALTIAIMPVSLPTVSMARPRRQARSLNVGLPNRLTGAPPAAPADLVNNEDAPAPPVISPEFDSGEESDGYVPPTPQSEEEEEVGKSPKKRRLYVPETPSPKRGRHEDSDDDEDDEPEVKGEEFVFGPGNPNSVPFKELDVQLNYDVATIAYDYFADPEDFFEMSIEDLRRM